MPDDTRLSPEQEALRLQGLRILARMIARAYLRDQADAARKADDRSPAGPDPEPSKDRDRDVD